MCQAEGVNLQQGMNFRLRGDNSVILMSVCPGAPYADQIEDGGRVLIYEGHDRPSARGGQDPNRSTSSSSRRRHAHPKRPLVRFPQRHIDAAARPELVRVYEKVRTGIWVFNGVFVSRRMGGTDRRRRCSSSGSMSTKPKNEGVAPEARETLEPTGSFLP